MDNQALMESTQPTTEELRLETLASKYRVRQALERHMELAEHAEAINHALRTSVAEPQDDPGCLDVQDSHNTPN